LLRISKTANLDEGIETETQTKPRAPVQPKGKDRMVAAMEKRVKGEALWAEGKRFLSAVWSYSFWLDIHVELSERGG